MRMQELPLVVQQAQEQQPFFTAGFPFRSGLKNVYITQINQAFISKEFAIIHSKKICLNLREKITRRFKKIFADIVT
nr:hypothetical protein [uncultured Flavobacterium sp.]